MIRFVKSIIYPHGKVHKKYGQYVGWSCISNIIVSIESALSTHSMLSVVGHASTELTISVNYIGKDIVGQLGGLWYINRNGKQADSNSTNFLNTSLFIQQSSNMIECTTPLLPTPLFIPIAGLANVGKNVSFTGIGAINARIVQTLAQDNNMGEIYAKISVLNTLGSSIGMGMGLCLVAYVPDHSTRMCLMPFLTMARVYTYKKAVKDLI